MDYNITYVENALLVSDEVDLFACRVCLATDIKLFAIHDCELGEKFESVMGFSVALDDGLPQHLCHYCFMWLQKYAAFRDRCYHAQEILQTASLLNQHINTDYLRLIDRDAENLSVPLTIESRNLINYEIIETEIVGEDEIKEEEDIKEEIDSHMFVDGNNVYTVVYENAEEEAVEKEPIMQRAEKTIRVTEHPHIEIFTLSREEQERQLQARRRSRNYTTAVHKCDKCFKGFLNVNTFHNHMVLHEPESGDMECAVCTLRFASDAKLKMHMMNVHEKKYLCRLCRHVSITGHRAMEHQRWHEGLTYDCKHCGQTFQRSTSCLTHIRKFHPSNFVCNQCGERFVSKAGLQAHTTKMHRRQKWEPRTPPACCEECGVVFASRDALAAHRASASRHTLADSKLFHYCTECGESFGSELELKEHRVMHSTDPVACPECGESCANYGALAVHCSAEHPPPPAAAAGAAAEEPKYVCDVCGRKLTTSIKLLIHMQMHTLDKPYVCPFCQKAFKFPQYLQTHIRTHTGERPYSCEECGMSFQAKANLNRHYKVHTGLKPYMCDLCGKSFSQSNSMKLHVRMVHLKLPDPYKHKRKLYKHARLARAGDDEGEGGDDC